MSNKEEYQEFCEKEGDNISIYSQYWWMNAACTGKDWDVLLIKDKAGHIIACLPYLIRKKWGQKIIVMPELTQTNGIYIKYPENIDEHHRLTLEKQVCYEADRQLRELGIDYFQQCFDSRFTNWLPFKWRGYQQTTRYTYRIDDLTDLDAVYSRFNINRKRKIKKAEESGLECKEGLTPEQFYNLHCKFLQKRNKNNLVGRETEISIINAAIKRGQGTILHITPKDSEEIYSALFLIWDSRYTCSLIFANDPDYTKTGASTLILWEAIKYAKKHSKGFDFEGSVEESIEESYNRWGSHQTPYMLISKSSSWLMKVKEIAAVLRRH